MSFRDSMSKFIREVMRAKTIHETIAKELREAHLKKLEAESGVEYAMSVVQYNQQRIKRLETRLLEHTEEGDYA
jgi:hypothetical protein